MTKNERIALVTGANKGIGFEVVRQLLRKSFHVFLGARNEAAGRAATEKLQNEGEVTFLHLDVADPTSIAQAVELFSKQRNRLDTLVNNAGVLLDDDKDVLKSS